MARRQKASPRVDVPVSALLRRHGRLTLEAARFRYIELRRPDPKASCQICEGGQGCELVVLSPVIDRISGQRITIALCEECAFRVAAPHPRRAVR